VEDGTVVLVGATTENPSFELNSALLSRTQVLILSRLAADALGRLLDRAEELVGRALPLTPEAREALIATADGDGRFLLNQAETLFSLDQDSPLDPAGLSALLHRRMPVYDKDREGHHNLIPRCISRSAGRTRRPRSTICADADGGRAAAVPAAAADAGGGRGYRPRGPAGAGSVHRGQGHVRFPRVAGGGARDRAGVPLPRHRAQIERGLYGSEGAWRSAKETGRSSRRPQS
jgi:hypothetical protein